MTSSASSRVAELEGKLEMLECKVRDLNATMRNIRDSHYLLLRDMESLEDEIKSLENDRTKFSLSMDMLSSDFHSSKIVKEK